MGPSILRRMPSINLKDPHVMFLSVFGIGLLPRAPGTFGSIASIPLVWGMEASTIPWIFFLPLLVFAIAGSSYIADITQKKYQVNDPSWIVIDEVLGMATGALFLEGARAVDLVLLFAYFRFFDIIKAWPASWIDRKIKNGLGTIGDDIIAGIYAGIFYLVSKKLLQLFSS